MELWQDIFIQAADDIGFTVTEEQARRFEIYRSELLNWNSKMSLVSLKTPYDLPVRHFVDSLTLLPHLAGVGKEKSRRLLDLGTGAGLPGIPLKIMIDALELTLVESSRKKTSFLKQVLGSLDLVNATVLNDRIENIIDRDPESAAFYDYVVSRAAFSLADLIEMAHHFLVPGGLVIGMKGKPSESELNDAQEALARLEMRFVKRHDLTLPFVEAGRSLFLFRKNPLPPESEFK
ncbi:MAG: 16S rRNA (guanine(527)-N(7))-methyltransferase RsmG [Syntrophales bacterium]|nr:16S rRNA (guanine(527)-N(7))-methyltransferase RsmG [Syntrophales bacterium]